MRGDYDWLVDCVEELICGLYDFIGGRGSLAENISCEIGDIQIGVQVAWNGTYVLIVPWLVPIDGREARMSATAFQGDCLDAEAGPDEFDLFVCVGGDGCAWTPSEHILKIGDASRNGLE